MRSRTTKIVFLGAGSISFGMSMLRDLALLASGGLIGAGVEGHGLEAGAVERFDPTTWTGVLPDELARIATAAKDAQPEERVSDVPEWTLKTFEVPGTKVREVYVGAVWRHPDRSPDPADPGRYGCGDTEFGEVVQYRLDADGATVIGRGERGSLRGALVGKAGRVHSLVWNEGDSVTVARLRGSKLGASTRLSTGSSHPEGTSESDYPLMPYCGP